MRSRVTGVGDRDAHHDVVDIDLRIGDLADPVADAEGAGVEQLILRLRAAPPTVHLDEIVVRECDLGIVVAPSQPAVVRQRVEIPPVLLDVLAVISLVVDQPEGTLFKDRVAAVPKTEGQTQPLFPIAQARLGRPRSSETPATGLGHAGSNPRRCHRHCSLRGP